MFIAKDSKKKVSGLRKGLAPNGLKVITWTNADWDISYNLVLQVQHFFNENEIQLHGIISLIEFV